MDKFSIIESFLKNRWKGKKSDLMNTRANGGKEKKKIINEGGSNLKEIISAQRPPLLKKRHQEKLGHSSAGR